MRSESSLNQRLHKIISYVIILWLISNRRQVYEYNTDYSDCYFYGPVRFVARKQDALIIADEEIWYDKDRNEKDKDRIVTLDLAGFATGNNQMSVTYVETKFNWSLQNTNDGPVFLDF